MGKYFIKDLEKLSGRKAHTSGSGETGHISSNNSTPTPISDSMTNNDLKNIINLALLNANGIGSSGLQSCLLTK
jgi:MerR family transcriptional regulator, light-induced transcriptional regulator